MVAMDRSPTGCSVTRGYHLECELQLFPTLTRISDSPFGPGVGRYGF